MKIGILLSNSTLYPSMVFDLMAGFNANLHENNISDAEIIIENIGVAGDYKIIQQKAENLLLAKQVKIVVAFIDQYAAKRIEPLFNAANCLLIVADTGGHIPGSIKLSPLTFLLSLQSAYGSALTALKAHADGVKKILFVSTYYEGGYEHCYAAFNAWNKNGISILGNFITPFQPNHMTIDDLKMMIEQTQPEAIIMQISRESGDTLNERSMEVNIPADIPVYASPFMFEYEWVTTVPYYFTKLTGYTAWTREIATDSNKKFMQSITEQTGKEAEIFHILGWDAASAALTAHKALSASGNVVRKAAELLSENNLESPRGDLKWNKQHRHWVAPMYEMKMTKADTGNYMPVFTGNVVDSTAQWEAFASEIAEGLSNRWYNMYLCLN